MFVHSESKFLHRRLWFVYYREILHLHHWFISPFVISRKRQLKALKTSKWCRRGLQVCCERVKMLNGITPALPVCEHGLRLWYEKHRFHEIKSLNNPGHLFNHYNITFAQDYTSWAENSSLSISNCCIFVYSFMSSKDLHWSFIALLQVHRWVSKLYMIPNGTGFSSQRDKIQSPCLLVLGRWLLFGYLLLFATSHYSASQG